MQRPWVGTSLDQSGGGEHAGETGGWKRERKGCILFRVPCRAIGRWEAEGGVKFSKLHSEEGCYIVF